MKCPHCKKDIFPGQFRCHHCNKVVAMEYEDKTEEKKNKKEKK